MVYSGVLWCTVVYSGVLWCTVVYSGVQWCTVVYCGVQWCTVVYSGVEWCIVVYSGVQWCTVVYSGYGEFSNKTTSYLSRKAKAEGFDGRVFTRLLLLVKRRVAILSLVVVKTTELKHHQGSSLWRTRYIGYIAYKAYYTVL